jgi:hypothetical protein
VALVAGAVIAATALAEPPPQVGTSLDSSHVFLTFSAGKSLAETPTSAANYMRAIDPGAKKLNFVDWLVNAGFISNASEWKPAGQQTYTSIPGDYGYGKINAFAHIIILNSADLGFIRNQYIRCKPDCKTPNAKVYTYLENYGATQFDDVAGVNVINQPRAITIALEKRPITGTGLRIADVAFEWAPAANGSNPTHNFGQIYAYVVQPEFDAASCDKPTRTLTLGNPIPDPLHPGLQKIDEQYVWPAGFNGVNQAIWDCKFNTRPVPIPATSDQSPDATHVFYRNPPPPYPVLNNQVFAPELDGLGTKMEPGVCLMCHGGNIPSNLTATQSWGATGEITEFKFLPADSVNSIFGINDSGSAVVVGASGSDLTEAGQGFELKKYAQAVAITHGATPAKTATFAPAPDGSITGVWNVGKSPDHALQVLFGWYQAFDGDYSMSGAGNPPVQNRNFVPVGWRTNAETSHLYTEVIQRDCRSCHLNREASLDFRTAKQFDGNAQNIRDWVFQPECDFLRGQVNPWNIVMPAARLTWERLWDGILGDSTAANVYALPPPGVDIDNRTLFGFGPAGAPNTIGPGTVAKSNPNSDINLLKAHFGYTPTSFCATH